MNEELIWILAWVTIAVFVWKYREKQRKYLRIAGVPPRFEASTSRWPALYLTYTTFRRQPSGDRWSPWWHSSWRQLLLGPERIVRLWTGCIWLRIGYTAAARSTAASSAKRVRRHHCQRSSLQRNDLKQPHYSPRIYFGECSLLARRGGLISPEVKGVRTVIRGFVLYSTERIYLVATL
jgi:hypothetical protein